MKMSEPILKEKYLHGKISNTRAQETRFLLLGKNITRSINLWNYFCRNPLCFDCL